MIVLYVFFLVLIIILLASVIPFCQYVCYKRKKEKANYRFSKQLFDRQYKDISLGNIYRYGIVPYKNFSDMKKLEYSNELP